MLSTQIEKVPHDDDDDDHDDASALCLDQEMDQQQAEQ